MGRAYAKEVDSLPATYEWARRSDIAGLEKFVKRAAGGPLYAVGSGGSLTAAALAAVLHRQAGDAAAAMTPMDILCGGNVGHGVSVLLSTAGGNNADIVGAFEAAASSPGRNVCVVSAGAGGGGRVGRLALARRRALSQIAAAPAGRDGFLATNSALASSVWIARAYAGVLGRGHALPEYGRLAGPAPDTGGIESACRLVVLHDVWGRAAAVDAESKMSESGLAAAQVADYRNFAHGRHHGLVAGTPAAAVVALVTPQSRSLADRTLALLPRTVPVCRIETGLDGPAAAVSLVASVMSVVGAVAAARGIDPGRPRVASFGRRLYSMPASRRRPARLAPFEETALRRKFGSAAPADPLTAKRAAALRRFLSALTAQRFGAAVFDYDGTLCGRERRFEPPSRSVGRAVARLLAAGMIVGIATGRGGSAGEGLRAAIPARLHAGVMVGYHNGAEVERLDAAHREDSGMPDPGPAACLSLIRAKRLLPAGTKISKRRGQVSLISDSVRAASLLRGLGAGAAAIPAGVRIVESGHSVDLLARGTSKLNLYRAVRRSIPGHLKVVCIGDKGRKPGNDHELLGTRYSLSVDESSDDPSSCWNLLPHGMSGQEGTIEYLSRFRTADGFMRTHMRKWDGQGGRRHEGRP